MKKYVILGIISLFLFSCSLTKKSSENIKETDKTETNIKQKAEEQKDVTSLFTIDTSSNSNLTINIKETEITIIDSIGNIKVVKETETNISNQKEQNGVIQNKVEDKSKSTEKTAVNQKKDIAKSTVVNSSTKSTVDYKLYFWIGGIILFILLGLWLYVKKINPISWIIGILRK